MRNFARVILFAAGFAAVAPLAANAATPSLFTPSAKLVQKINTTYGTTFKLPASHANMAAQHQAQTQRAG